MSVQLLPAAPAAKATAKAGKGHLNQVDLVRVLTFASVIAVPRHHVHQRRAPTSPPTGRSTLLHFTRSVFFFLTGFVLVYTYRRRPLAPATSGGGGCRWSASRT